MTTWQKRLEPYARMYDEIRRHIEEQSDETLRQLIVDAKEPSGSNCWFAIKNVAPVVAEAAQSELVRRYYEAKQ